MMFPGPPKIEFKMIPLLLLYALKELICLFPEYIREFRLYIIKIMKREYFYIKHQSGKEGLHLKYWAENLNPEFKKMSLHEFFHQKTLDLSNLGIDYIPPQLDFHIGEINLSNNRIKNLPIFQCQKTKINLDSNKIKIIPQGYKQNYKLSLNNNPIEYIHEESDLEPILKQKIIMENKKRMDSFRKKMIFLKKCS